MNRETLGYNPQEENKKSIQGKEIKVTKLPPATKENYIKKGEYEKEPAGKSGRFHDITSPDGDTVRYAKRAKKEYLNSENE